MNKSRALPPKFLNSDWRKLNLLDIAVLLYHVHKGASDDNVGFEDARNTLDSLSKQLCRKKVYVSTAALESALWSCNLLDELGRFDDIRGRSFDEFLHDLIPGEKFDRFYNTIDNKE